VTVLQKLRPASIALAIGLCAIVPISVCPQAAAQKADHLPVVLSPQELFQRISPSVFIIEVLDESGSLLATGSGVAVELDQVVTNKHVIDGGVTLRIKHGSRTWPAAVTYLDPDHDLCRLTAKGLNAPVVPVRLSSALTVGERVYSVGAPEGLELTISEGLISGLREFEDIRLIQTSAAISPGSSGGGLFDSQAQLVGITTFFLKEGQNLNFALPGDWVKDLVANRVPLKGKTQTSTSDFEVLSYFQLAAQMVDTGEYEKAVRASLELLRMKPDYAEAWNNLGVAYDGLQQYDKELSAYQEAIRLKPDYADAWYDLGVVYNKLKQYEKAISADQEAIRLKPDYAGAWFNLGVFYHEMPQQTDKAVSAYQEAIRLAPGQYWVWGNLGVAYIEMHQYDKATTALQEALRLKPDHALSWYHLGEVYGAQRNRSKVMEVYKKLEALDQNLADDFFRKIVRPFDSP